MHGVSTRKVDDLVRALGVDGISKSEVSRICAVGSGGQSSFTISLPAARKGAVRDGRRYTVTVRAADNGGNVATASAIVTVLHDRRH